MIAPEFWGEVRRRRNLFFLWWVSWPFAGILIISLYTAMFRQRPPVAFGPGLLITWGVVWSLIARRLSRLPCPNCSKPAIAHPYFFMRHAQCQHCGLKFGDERTPRVELAPTSYKRGPRSSFIIALIWLYFIASAATQGWGLPSSSIGDIPLPIVIVFLPFLLLISVNPHTIPGQFAFGKFFDKRFGSGAYIDFVRRARPELLLAITAFEIGGIGLLRLMEARPTKASLTICGFFISGGFTFLVIYFRSHWRKEVASP